MTPPAPSEQLQHFINDPQGQALVQNIHNRKERRHQVTPPILAIDPGNTHSGYALIEPGTCKPISAGKIPNAEILHLIATTNYARLSIEMIASYGMAVGKEVFDTCVWIGRFVQQHIWAGPDTEHALVYRRDVKLHHCHSSKAKDANITQALIDRFAPGQPNRGKGTKANPGWFHGFAADIWQAYALAVHTNDTRHQEATTC